MTDSIDKIPHPADGEVAELAQWLRLQGCTEITRLPYTRAADLLEQLAAPAGEEPSDEMIAECLIAAGVDAMEGENGHTYWEGWHDRIMEGIRAVLTRYGRPAPAPTATPHGYAYRSMVAPQATPPADGEVATAISLALSVLEGWANHGEWAWPESALHQAKQGTSEAIASLQAVLTRYGRPAPAPVPKCETCNGVGTIDERLGGYSFSNPEATCPDCDGTGEARNTAPAPVPVAERPWERDGWCDEQNRFWMFRPGMEGVHEWRYSYLPEDVSWFRWNGVTLLLPWWALPLPGGCKP